MFDVSGRELVQLIFLFVMTVLVARIYVAWRGDRPLEKYKGEDLPILSASPLLDTSDLSSIHKDTVQGLRYNFMVSRGGAEAIFMVQLGYDTGLHIVGYGANSRLNNSQHSLIENSRLKKIAVEGDVSKKVTLYCTPGKQTKVLQVFASDVLALLADFCQSYDLEIYRDLLFISPAASAYNKDDRASVVNDVETFLAANQQLLTRL